MSKHGKKYFNAHDADEPPDVYSADALRHDVAIGLGERELHVDGLLPALHLRHHIGKRHIGVGAHHQVGVHVLFCFSAQLGTVSDSLAEHVPGRNGGNGKLLYQQLSLGSLSGAGRAQ